MCVCMYVRMYVYVYVHAYPGRPKSAIAFCRFSEKLAFHLSEKHMSPPKTSQKEGSVLDAFCVSLRRNANCIAHSLPSSFSSLRSLPSRWRSCQDFTYKRRCGLHKGSEFGICFQERTQCCNAAVGWARLPWSGVHTVLKRSSWAGALTMVRRARSVVTKHLPWSGLL